MSSLSAKARNIGIFGGGTVGGGIVEILERKKAHLKELTGADMTVSKICVQDASKERDFALPPGCEITDKYNDILLDESIDLVVEVMGGTTDAKKVVFDALRAGKDVVTANKALIAMCLPEIEAVLNEVNKNREGDLVEFRYEAAVCGGIPVIRSLQSDFVGDEVEMLSGIINGCTNYMLTAMDKGGKSYDEALAEAAALGYAEADPTLDVGGFDARSKLRIMVRLAFGLEVEEEEISCRGITDLTALDFQYAKMMGGTVKLIAVAKKVSDTKIAAFVSPCYVANTDSLASVSGATNAIEVISENLQASTYIGQGAGRYPTANSCVNDIVALAKGDKTKLPFNPARKDKKFVNNYDSVFYIRLRYRDGLGITRQCGEICEKHGVSIHSILQNPVTSKKDAVFVLVTEKVSLQAVKNVCADVEGLDWCRGPAFFMPVLREDWVAGMSPSE
jgi:homoserine dehydrogenase